jgi:hypothetical protein
MQYCYLEDNMNREYDNYYKEMMDKFSNESNIRQKIGVSGYRIGDKYKETKLMLCGRAPNGMESSYAKTELSKKYKEIMEIIAHDKNDMSWMNNVKSQFLKIGEKIIIDKYNKIPSEWYKYIIWTNLMKISPSLKGNPSERDWKIQKDYCEKLFKMEIDYFKPKNVIMMTGFDWAFDFIQYLKINPNTTLDTKFNRIVVGKYKYNDSNIIVTKRPEARSREKVYSEINKFIE